MYWYAVIKQILLYSVPDVSRLRPRINPAAAEYKSKFLRRGGN
jgi:hypothetical protein